MAPRELEFIEPKLGFSDPSAVLISLFMFVFSPFDNEIAMRDNDLYEKISDGHYRKISTTLDQIKSQFEKIFGKELEAERFCHATKKFIEKRNEIECSLNRMFYIIGKENADATSRSQQSLNAHLDHP